MNPRLLLLALVAALGLGVGAARADAVVTLCQNAGQAGAGTNLDAAVRIGGHVTFACPPKTTIALDKTLRITSPTTLDGGGQVTLSRLPTDTALALTDPPLVVEGLSFLCVAGSTPTLGVVSGSADVSFQQAAFTGCPRAISLLLPSGSVSFTQVSFQNSGLGLMNVASSLPPSPGGAAPFSTVTLSQVTAAGAPAGAARFMHLRANTVRIVGLTLKSAGQSVLVSDSLTATTVNVSGGQAASGSPDGTTGDPEASAEANGGALLLLCLTPASGCHAAIAEGSFSGNQAAGGGGAIRAQGPSLSLADTTFMSNTATGGGGGLSFSAGLSAARLSLLRMTFKANGASDGAGLIYDGATVLAPIIAREAAFTGNQARASGGAVAGDGPLELSRGYLVGNTAGGQGGALAIGGADPSLVSNTVAAGNTSAGAALWGVFKLVNASVANNTGGGVAGAGTSLTNSLLDANRPFNCGAPATDGGHNLQNAGADCGGAIARGDPGLDHFYAPSAFGPAAGKGDPKACGAAPVDGVDLYGSKRGPGGCAIGAVETNPYDKALASAPGQAGRLLPKVIALSAMIYLAAGLILLLARRRPGACPAFRYALCAAIAFVVSLIAWLLLEKTTMAADLGRLVWPWVVVFIIGCWRVARAARES